jgi:DNA-binding NtrC family response regulator
MARRRHALDPDSGRTVLIIDDDCDYLFGAQILLGMEGHHLLVADNCHQALRILGQERVDLVLVNSVLPGMTGEEVVAKLRRVDSFTQIILQNDRGIGRPPSDVMRRYGIYGSFDKSEGPEKLLLMTAIGLLAAHAVRHGHASAPGGGTRNEAMPARVAASCR